MNILNKDVSFIKSIGSKFKFQLNENSIFTCYDLLKCYPIKYEIINSININEGCDNENILINGEICSEVTLIKLKSNQTSLVFDLKVNDKVIRIIATNNDFLRFTLNKGNFISIYGKLKFMENKLLSKKIFTRSINDYVIPIYKIGDIPQDTIKRFIGNIFDLTKDVDEKMSDNLLKSYELVDKYTFYKLLHSPKSKEDLIKVARRQKYDTYVRMLMSDFNNTNNDSSNIVDEIRSKEIIFNDFITYDEEKNLYNQIYSNIQNLKTIVK